MKCTGVAVASLAASTCESGPRCALAAEPNFETPEWIDKRELLALAAAKVFDPCRMGLLLTREPPSRSAGIVAQHAHE
jgi:hypothetical protein